MSSVHPDRPSLLPEDRARVEALARGRRLEAFDNVDIEALLASLDRAGAIRLGQYMMRHGRTLGAYRDGQAILTIAYGHR